MRFIVAAAVAGLAAVAQAGSNATYVTEVVTQLTTYCPAATQITHNGQTYTVTEATTLTITNCPCTVTKPVYSSVVTSCSTCAPATSAAPSAPVYSSPAASSPVAPVYTSSAPAAPVYPAPSSSAPVVAPYPSSNGTTPAGPVGTAPGSSGSPSASAPASYTGAANKVSYGAAGMLAALGLVAAL